MYASSCVVIYFYSFVSLPCFLNIEKYILPERSYGEKYIEHRKRSLQARAMI